MKMQFWITTAIVIAISRGGGAKGPGGQNSDGSTNSAKGSGGQNSGGSTNSGDSVGNVGGAASNVKNDAAGSNTAAAGTTTASQTINNLNFAGAFAFLLTNVSRANFKVIKRKVHSITTIRNIRKCFGRRTENILIFLAISQLYAS